MNKAFSLVEIIIVLVIVGIFSSITYLSVVNIMERERIYQTQWELKLWKNFCIGNSETKIGVVRSDFGYFGRTGRYDYTVAELKTVAKFSEDMLYDSWGNAYEIVIVDGDLVIRSPKFSEKLINNVATSFSGNKLIGVITDKSGSSINTSDTGIYEIRAKNVYSSHPKYSSPYTTNPNSDSAFEINNVYIGVYEVRCVVAGVDTLYNYCGVAPGKNAFVTFVFNQLPNTTN